MNQWRISKYNPQFKRRRNAHLDEDWTSVSDMGRGFNGRVLDLSEYMATEDRYISVALRFLEESRQNSLSIVGLETDRPVLEDIKDLGLADLLIDGPELKEGQRLFVSEIERVCRLNLRELLWCKLEEPGLFFIHFGYDYYMYIGSSSPSTKPIVYAEEVGLFVERITSPYY